MTNITVVPFKNHIEINGEKIEYPKGMKKNSSCLSIVNGKVFLDKYEYIPKEKRFKRTIRAFFI